MRRAVSIGSRGRQGAKALARAVARSAARIGPSQIGAKGPNWRATQQPIARRAPLGKPGPQPRRAEGGRPLPQGRRRTVDDQPRDPRFLGRMVRAVQGADPGAGEGRGRICRQGRGPGQAQRRRGAVHRRAVPGALDPDGLRDVPGPAGRRPDQCAQRIAAQGRCSTSCSPSCRSRPAAASRQQDIAPLLAMGEEVLGRGRRRARRGHLRADRRDGARQRRGARRADPRADRWPGADRRGRGRARRARPEALRADPAIERAARRARAGRGRARRGRARRAARRRGRAPGRHGRAARLRQRRFRRRRARRGGRHAARR